MGYAFLQARASIFVDEERKCRFLCALPHHSELVANWHSSACAVAVLTRKASQGTYVGQRAQLHVVRLESG
jgi:hypothetical protein